MARARTVRIKAGAGMETIGETLVRAVALHGSGHLAEAEPLYRQVLRAAPEAAQAWRLLSLILRRRDPAAAAGAARRALALDPALAEGGLALALALQETGGPAPQGAPPGGPLDQAAAALLRSVRLAPEHAEPYAALGAVHRARGDMALAEAAFRAALLIQPDHLAARLSLGVLAVSRGGGDDAAALLEGVLAQQPDEPDALLNLSLARRTQGQAAAAGPLLRRLLAISPGHRRARLLLVRLRLIAGDLDEAVALLGPAAVMPSGPSDRDEAAHLAARCRRYRALAVLAHDADAPFGLAVRGPFRDTSGYAWMVRRFVRGMAGHGIPVHLLDLSVDFVPAMVEEQRDPFYETLDRPVRARALLTFAIPGVVERVPGLQPVTFSMFEARTVPSSWLADAADLPHLIVPTRSSFDAWADAGFPAERLHLCPLGVDAVPEGAVAPLTIGDSRGRRLADYPVRVLNVSDLIDRKNLDGLLRVWLRATTPDCGAALVLKLGKGGAGQDRVIGSFIDKVARSVGRRLDAAAPIFIVQGILSDGAMAGLMAACTHYWSLSHGEGWDLPMAQAGAMGLRLMAPRHSAYTTYLSEDIATLIPSRVVPATPPYQGLEWWAPDEDAAAEALARAVAGRDTPRRSPRAALTEAFGWPQATARLLGILREVKAL